MAGPVELLKRDGRGQKLRPADKGEEFASQPFTSKGLFMEPPPISLSLMAARSTPLLWVAFGLLSVSVLLQAVTCIAVLSIQARMTSRVPVEIRQPFGLRVRQGSISVTIER